MVNLPKLSIATKLYAIFALLATACVVLAGVAAPVASRHSDLTDVFEAGAKNAQNVERVSGLIYAVEMEARGLFLARDAAAARSSGTGVTRLNDRIGEGLAEWERGVQQSDTGRFR